jgi:hypothetical protein
MKMHDTQKSKRITVTFLSEIIQEWRKSIVKNYQRNNNNKTPCHSRILYPANFFNERNGEERWIG